MTAGDSCPIFEHLRGAQGVCTPQPAHFDLIGVVQALAAQRDHTAAVERARSALSERRNRAIVAAAIQASFRAGRLVGTRQVEQVVAQPQPVRQRAAIGRPVTR